MTSESSGSRGFLRRNGLSIVTVSLFLVVWLGGQVVAGFRVYNADEETHGQPTITFGEYLTSAHFGEATFENWESEFLQMGAYVLLTVWLRQRGSAESKPLDGDEEVDEDPTAHRRDPDAPWPVRRGGLVLAIYRRSLSIAFFTLFGMALLLHLLTGAAEFNADRVEHGEATVSTWEFLHRAQFWFESLQNWQSEFLAVAAIVILTIFLRQQGSPESKPVHAPHQETGS
ncbi:MAG: DUF6766 family protein [Acidimicrobiales bacterium]